MNNISADSVLSKLAPAERAYLALSAEHNESALIELAAKYVDATEIKDRTDYTMIMRGGIELQKARVSIEKTGKAARDDANRFRTAVIAEEKRLIQIIAPEENRLRTLRKDYDDAKEREAEEARMAEIRRVSDITARIQSIQSQADGLIGADATGIQMRLDAVSTIVCNETLFAEFVQQAKEVKTAVELQLNDALAEREAFEAQQAEASRVAAEQAARQAELDRQAAEQKDRERQAQAKISVDRLEASRIMAEATERAEEIEREARERLEAEQAEARRRQAVIEAEKRAKEEAERQKVAEAQEAERQEAIRPDKEKLLTWCQWLQAIEPPIIVDIQLQAYRNSAAQQVHAIGERLAGYIESAS